MLRAALALPALLSSAFRLLTLCEPKFKNRTSSFLHSELTRKGWKSPMIPLSMRHLTEKPLRWKMFADTFTVSCPLPLWFHCSLLVRAPSAPHIATSKLGKIHHWGWEHTGAWSGVPVTSTSRNNVTCGKKQAEYEPPIPGERGAARYEVRHCGVTHIQTGHHPAHMFWCAFCQEVCWGRCAPRGSGARHSLVHSWSGCGGDMRGTQQSHNLTKVSTACLHPARPSEESTLCFLWGWPLILNPEDAEQLTHGGHSA